MVRDRVHAYGAWASMVDTTADAGMESWMTRYKIVNRRPGRRDTQLRLALAPPKKAGKVQFNDGITFIFSPLSHHLSASARLLTGSSLHLSYPAKAVTFTFTSLVC
jgi:hypothetical protein